MGPSVRQNRVGMELYVAVNVNVQGGENRNMEYILPLPKWMGMRLSQPQCWHPTPAYTLSARLWIVHTADGVCREEGV